ncbi:polysaccharide deacetylase family protein [Halovivax sp.]|uniref:polysaccharide deacetylase family protein n=1 Tax=Halovivax sp. TaxID=1935978 RepID=UPI0025C63E51|nr:polysaccharide deacetylase family protein [Halovivax sp.]
MNRRTYLTTATASAALAVAGCTGADDADNETDDGFGDFDDDAVEESPDLLGTWDDFADLDAWEATRGSLSADEDRSVEGSQSAHIEVSESETSGRIERSLTSPLDCSEVVPGLAMASSGSGAPAIQLWDADGNKAEYRQRTDAANPFVRRNFGLSKMEGDLDPSRIAEIHVVHWVGDEQESELWVDDLYFTPRAGEGLVSLQFNGGYEEDYTTALPILDARDLPASTFVATDRIREGDEAEGDRLTEDQLAELADAGWTIGSFGARGLRVTDVDDDEEKEADVVDAVSWLEDNGYEDGTRFFSFPGDRFDERSYEIVQDHHDLAFAGTFPAQGHAANPHLCTRVSHPDPQEALNLLEWTAAVGGITTMAFNRVDAEDAETLEALADGIRAHVEEGELDVITPAELADEYVD